MNLTALNLDNFIVYVIIHSNKADNRKVTFRPATCLENTIDSDVHVSIFLPLISTPSSTPTDVLSSG
jgi:hypothetical protein